MKPFPTNEYAVKYLSLMTKLWKKIPARKEKLDADPLFTSILLEIAINTYTKTLFEVGGVDYLSKIVFKDILPGILIETFTNKFVIC